MTAGTFKTVHGGTVTILANGDFTYVAPEGFLGTDSFVYRVRDAFGGSANDFIFGLAGDDRLSGGDGADVLAGDDGRDTLAGGAGGDTLYGQGGKDTLGGGDGADKLVGGAGVDILTGGRGADLFVFDAATGTGADKVQDFGAGDLLCVKGSDYGLAAGALPDASYFASTGAANVGHARFLYNTDTRVLSWDADGNAATANIAIASFASKVTLDFTDFLVL